MTDISPEIVKRGILPQNRPPQRPEQRPEMREEPRLQRRVTQSSDQFELPDEFNRRMAAQGMTAEWKRHEVAGKPDDYYQADIRANHWQPVLAEDEPTLAPYGQTQGPIRKGANTLMKRQTYLCEDAEAETRSMTARRLQQNAKRVRDAPPGTFERTHPNNPSMIRRTTERDSLDNYA